MKLRPISACRPIWWSCGRVQRSQWRRQRQRLLRCPSSPNRLCSICQRLHLQHALAVAGRFGRPGHAAQVCGARWGKHGGTQCGISVCARPLYLMSLLFQASMHATKPGSLRRPSSLRR